MKRRTFIKTTALGTGAITSVATHSMAREPKKKINIGFIGVGGRGRGLLNSILSIDWVDVPAVCDIDPKALAATQEIIKKYGRNKATEYGS